jgi:hypothetical protein
MPEFDIKVDPALEKYVGRLLQMPTYKPLVDRLVEEATRLREEAITTWPVSRRYADGQPLRKPHSRDNFGPVTVEVLPSKIRVGFENRARYVYYIRSHLTGLSQNIRSHLTGLSQTEQRETAKRRPGESMLDLELRVRDTQRKKSAMIELIRKPIKRRKKELIADVKGDLVRIANGR